jgi:uncharacterized protein (TIGR03435 family)
MTLRSVRAIVFAALLTATPAAQQPEFEVASVKPNSSGAVMIGIHFPGVGQFKITNMPLREMVRFAYEVQPQQIEGGPEWATSDRFDIIAKAEGKPTLSQIHAMMRTLLVDRFALKTHRETRDMPIYELVLARTDRRLGEKLLPATPECRPVVIPAGMPKPPPPPPGAADGRAALPEDDIDGGLRCGALFGPGFMTLRQFTMARFARDLTMIARRVVVDRTGLTGRYDIDVEFTWEFRPPPPGVPELSQPASDGPSLFTAMQEQLGLKLESARGPVEMIVIESAQRPEPD